jgi:serine/threonine-protein kinase
MTLCSAEAAPLQRMEDPHVGQTLAGKYRVEKLIKHGGMGSVYRGKHVLMDKTVAIKVLRPSLAVDNAVVARFSREAKAASKISHPHAVSVTDFGEAENGVVFLVMEFLDGRTLKEAISQEGAFSGDRAVEIVRQVAGALDAAHSQGVVHRDLKSENIMLVRHNGDEWAKVLDFGIAKIQQPEGLRDVEITEANLVVGTPQYMSPEQCSQTGPLDPRSDVYSLGIIIFEMLTGRVPFTGESPTVIMMKQVQDPPPSVLLSRPDLPAAVDDVIKRALAKQPVDRFQTAGDLSAALLKAASGKSAFAPAVAAFSPAETVANTPVNVAAVDADEATLVRPSDEITVVRQRHPPPSYTEPVIPPEPARFNPWRVMVPAAIALVAVFAVVFFLTRGPSPTDQTQGQPLLSVDPSSQPVQPAGSPTGQSESDIQSVSVPSPTPAPTHPNVNTNTGSQVPATVPGNSGSNENTNSGRGNRNSNQPSESPAPKITPEAPPPPPSPTVRTVPKATPAPTPDQR